jgi:hypothetical protein
MGRAISCYGKRVTYNGLTWATLPWRRLATAEERGVGSDFSLLLLVPALEINAPGNQHRPKEWRLRHSGG